MAKKKQFTEKQLKCIARHLQQYVDIVIHHEVNSPRACEVCDEAQECWEQWPSGEYSWNLLCDISGVSGVDILRGTTAEKQFIKEDLNYYETQ